MKIVLESDDYQEIADMISFEPDGRGKVCYDCDIEIEFDKEVEYTQEDTTGAWIVTSCELSIHSVRTPYPQVSVEYDMKELYECVIEELKRD